MKTSSVLVAVLAALPMAFAQTQSLAPSPVQSVGCEPHGDHWHCDGPRTSGDVAAPTPGHDHDHDEEDHDHDHDEEDHDHDHSSGTGSLAPSPTESIGCEPHGDHWHCDGPKVTPGPAGTPGPNSDDSESDDVTSSTQDGAAATPMALPIAGLLAAAAVLAL